MESAFESADWLKRILLVQAIKGPQNRGSEERSTLLLFLGRASVFSDGGHDSTSPQNWWGIT